jgi:hypothetical protein
MASLFLPKKVVKKMSIGHASKMSNFGLDYIFSQGSDASNFLGGWDGQAFHPNVKEDEKLNVFATDICSAAPIEFAVRIKQINIYIYKVVVSVTQKVRVRSLLLNYWSDWRNLNRSGISASRRIYFMIFLGRCHFDWLGLGAVWMGWGWVVGGGGRTRAKPDNCTSLQ